MTSDPIFSAGGGEHHRAGLEGWPGAGTSTKGVYHPRRRCLSDPDNAFGSRHYVPRERGNGGPEGVFVS